MQDRSLPEQLEACKNQAPTCLSLRGSETQMDSMTSPGSVGRVGTRLLGVGTDMLRQSLQKHAAATQLCLELQLLEGCQSMVGPAEHTP